VGTAQYLSPEQAPGETVDSRSDVYSTGCLLYELLTGRPPFVGDSPVSVAYQHVREPPQPPSTVDPELPPEIDAIVMKALAKRREDRYQSAAAMRADIDRYLTGKPVVAPVVPLDDANQFVPPEAQQETVSIFGGPVPDREEEPRRRWPLILLVAAVVALLVAAAIVGPLLFRPAPGQTPVPSVLNMTRAEAQHRLEKAKLTLGNVDRQASTDVPAGRVISQNPAAAALVAPGAAVDIALSTGKPDVVVPYVIGEDKTEASQKLRAAGLRVKLVKKQSDAARNKVVGTNPDPAESVSTNTLVTVFYSAGPKKVPSVVGMKQHQAEAVLQKAGFNVSVSYDSLTAATKGTVLAQSPEASTTQPKGATVVITVSSYVKPPPSPTPTPTPTPSPTPTPTPTPTTKPSPTPTASPVSKPSKSPGPPTAAPTGPPARLQG
jgi:eukaryotic-like serine/threonine-protein kinase